VIRVFPRKTKATPDDGWINKVPDIPRSWVEVDEEIHISCTFTWDIPTAEGLVKKWEGRGYDVKLGGPAFDDSGGDFVPGRYLKPGYVITSRGCDHECWFCLTHKREGGIRELPITDGWIVQDNNLLQCSEKHIRDVFAMLARQPEKAQFTGGLEAAILKDWHVHELAKLKPKSIYLAYDIPDDYELLCVAAKRFRDAGLLSSHNVGCYVLIGYPKDTFSAAEHRLNQVLALGLTPFAMLWTDPVHENWGKFQKKWVRPAIIYGKKVKAGSERV